MKKFLSACCLLLGTAFLFTGCSSQRGFNRDGDDLIYTSGELTAVLDGTTGMLKEFSTPDTTLSLEGVVVDVGVEESWLFGQLGYKDFSSLATYELPLMWLKMKELPAYTLESVTAGDNGFTVTMTLGDYTVSYQYRLENGALAMEAVISTAREEAVTVNGAAFLVQGISGYDLAGTTYEFPGSTPDGQIPYQLSSRYRATVSDYSAPVVQIADESHYNNILFVNEVEKWTTGCYYDGEERPCAAFLSATEGYLDKDNPISVGTLYLLPTGTAEASDRLAREASYAEVSDFWAAIGYHTPQDTTAADGLQAIYSGHPYGTMDTGYFNRLTLQEYAGQLSDISEMGFSAVWLLPVFQHTGDNVYEPIDQGLIDSRYGGLEGAAVYLEKAHSLNLKVLFDFVPHGPRPVYPFAKEHDDWISKDRQGNNQIEWECVSFDYNNPGYYDYTVALAKYYAETISLDGARIDCAMGGLPNYSSASGLRASASSLQAGVNMLKAIREGFTEGGKEPLLLPENFHPSPAYAAYTDVFYDMPLYRCMYNLNHSDLTETEYVSRLAHFLTAEQGVSVSGQKKLRFLGNHDTVTWTFDSQRAQTLYGTEKAKALWMALGWIDGVLYIYQGDEDPAAYGLEGENLFGFFTELLAAKAEYLPVDYATRYLDTQSPVFAFYRYDAQTGDARLVLVNLSSQVQGYTLSSQDGDVLAAIGEYEKTEDVVTLSPYSGVILDAKIAP